ncbi:hypothetical protein HPB51_009089 [Rhipicephalus microplus]|uniref:Uncharacterized protein n=1 Tax=Rhipicephalus microplus TaxID=6941 RepID=A0A9J6EZZ3_RHIMP|nr:hypothetical protein HPB51_009089 [Rhipicephalus microplus]
MDVHKPTQDDMIRAEEKLQARLHQLGVVSDSEGTKSFVIEVLDKVCDVVDVVAFSPDDTTSTESEADPLLSYLDAEKKLCPRKRIRYQAALRRRLRTRLGNGDSASPPIEEYSELIQRVESVVLGKAAEYKACSEEEYCAWLQQVRDGLEKNKETRLPKELARCATLAMKIDVDGARNCLHVQDLLAERVSALRDSLASRVRLCKSVVAKAIDARARQENATDAAVATTAACSVNDSLATGVSRLCSELVAAMAAKVDQLDEMALRRQRANELVDRLEEDMNARCQGSVSKWFDDIHAYIDEKDDKNLLIKRALLIEFHQNPQRFVARMKSAMLLKKRGALPLITRKEDDAQHP